MARAILGSGKRSPLFLSFLCLLALPVAAQDFPWDDWEILALQERWGTAWLKRSVEKQSFVLCGSEKRPENTLYTAFGVGFFKKPFLLVHFPNGKEKKTEIRYPLPPHTPKLTEAPEVVFSTRSLRYWVLAREPKDKYDLSARMNVRVEPVLWTPEVPGFLTITETYQEDGYHQLSIFNPIAVLDGNFQDMRMDMKASDLVTLEESLEMAKIKNVKDGREGILLQLFEYQSPPESRVKIGVFLWDEARKKPVYQPLRDKSQAPTPVPQQGEEAGYGE